MQPQEDFDEVAGDEANIRQFGLGGEHPQPPTRQWGVHDIRNLNMNAADPQIGFNHLQNYVNFPNTYNLMNPYQGFFNNNIANNWNPLNVLPQAPAIQDVHRAVNTDQTISQIAQKVTGIETGY